MSCRVCGSQVDYFAEAQILNQHQIKYFRCVQCSFIQTETPYWLDQAYSEAITNSDIGLVARNLETVSKVTALIRLCFPQASRFVDYGGGYGMFVRLMRDKGFDFYRSDKYAKNLFAKQFEASETISYDLLTAFEVFEHLVNPTDEVERMLKLSDAIFFSTTLLPVHQPKPGEWWYYCLDHGQHVGIYTKQTLTFLARKFSIFLYSDHKNFHLLTRKPVNPQLFQLSVGFGKWVDVLLPKRPSLLPQDYFSITGMRIN